MPTEADYYRILGLEPGATMEEVRAAYRREACRYHPDVRRDDGQQAEHRLRELIVAYKTIARRLSPAAWARSRAAQQKTFTPQDFARQGHVSYWQQAQELIVEDAALDAGPAMALYDPYPHPTRDETRTFAVLWVLATILGIVFGGLAAMIQAHRMGAGELGWGETILSVLVGEVVYVMLAAAAVVLVILTRKIVRMTLQLARQRWLFLPGPDSSRTLPPSAKRLDT